MSAIADPRIVSGMTAMLEERRQALASGAGHLGWKLGFGSATFQEKLGLSGPLVGYLTDRTLVGSGSSVDTTSWEKPVFEPEIAIYMGADLPSGSDRAAVGAAIGALGPAIELADVSPPPEDVEAVLSCNIYHRAVILGPPDESRAGADLAGMSARIVADGEEAGGTTELEALTGNLVTITGQLADTLAAMGETLRAGDVIIAGSVIPAIFTSGPASFTYTLSPFDPVSVSVT